MSTTRKYTTKLFEAMEQDMIDPIRVVEMCLSYMSEDEVKDMCWSNDLFVEEEEEEDE